MLLQQEKTKSRGARIMSMRTTSWLFVLLMCIVQLFSKVKNDDWLFFYDVVMFGFVLMIFILNIHDKFIAVLIPFPLIMLGVVIYQYTNSISTEISGPIYCWSFLALTLVLIYIIQIKWRH